MKAVLSIILFFASMLLVQAGGPSLDSKKLSIQEVMLMPDRILMKVDGTVGFLTTKTGDEMEGTREQGNAKRVELVVEDALLVIPRKKWKHPGGDAYEVYLDWDAYCEEMAALGGKTIFCQMWMTELLLEGGWVKEIRADVLKYHVLDEVP